MAILVAMSSSKWEHTSPLVAAALFGLATVLVAIAALGRLWCSLYIAGYKTKSLVTDGPYSMCRNPLYFFSLLGAIGIGLATETLTIPLIILVAFAAYYPGVIRGEERTLKGRHGADFSTYIATVPRFFPKWRYPSEPETYVVKPIVFRRHIMSALWFIWLLGAVEVVEAFHESHFLPVIFEVY